MGHNYLEGYPSRKYVTYVVYKRTRGLWAFYSAHPLSKHHFRKNLLTQNTWYKGTPAWHNIFYERKT